MTPNHDRTRSHRPTGLLLSLTLAAGLAGCAQDPKVAGCLTDDDCTGGDRCVAQQCQACAEDAHCGADQRCVSGRCETACVCPDGRACAADGACAPEEAQIPEAEADTLASRRQALLEACGVTDPDALRLPPLQFEFDRAELTADARQQLEAAADCLRALEVIELVVEGHCDERGTEEYNLALGHSRAESVRTYLGNLGLDRSRLRPISKGKLEPVCDQSTDGCYARNRRVLLLMQ